MVRISVLERENSKALTPAEAPPENRQTGGLAGF
jgi:hypothetical protein